MGGGGRRKEKTAATANAESPSATHRRTQIEAALANLSGAWLVSCFCTAPFFVKFPLLLTHELRSHSLQRALAHLSARHRSRLHPRFGGDLSLGPEGRQVPHLSPLAWTTWLEGGNGGMGVEGSRATLGADCKI